MTQQEQENPKASSDELVLQQQYLRAMSSFEGIILGQMQVKSDLSNRLNTSIKAGLVILSIVALSIMSLLIMLSTQVTRISDAVGSMNSHFTSVSRKMNHIQDSVMAMETQIGLLPDIEQYTTIMNQEMGTITLNIHAMEASVGNINQQFNDMRYMIDEISTSIRYMNGEVQVINHEMNRMSEPAKTFNKFFPLP